MSAPLLRRIAACLAGVWAGLAAGVGLVAAPVLFSTLPRAEAGRAAARMFAVDAYLGLVFAVVLLCVVPRLPARGARDDAPPTRFGADLALVLLAVGCIVAGHFGVQPMPGAARAAGGATPFAVVHGAASALFIAKLFLVAVLAWRLSAGPNSHATESASTPAKR